MSTKTKKQMQEEYDMLKASFLEIKDQIQELKNKENKELEELEEPAFGIFLTDDSIYKLIELRYNPVTKEAKVISIEDAAINNKDYSLAHMKLRERNTNVIMDRVSKKWSKLHERV